MAGPELEAQVAAAKAYEDLFVPALFGRWAEVVADAAFAPGQRVLDVGCGTGALARQAQPRVGDSGYVAGLDAGAGMLEVARGLSPGIDWRLGAAESLPFADEEFDVVASQFGLMFMERRKAIGEMLRVLKPAGRIVVAVWDEVAKIPAYADEIALIERLAGPAAGEALRAPFALGDRVVLEREFRDAGARDLSIRTLGSSAVFPSIRVLVEADLRGWLPVMGVHLDDERIERILEEAEQELRAFVAGDGRVRFETSAHVVTVLKT